MLPSLAILMYGLEKESTMNNYILKNWSLVNMMGYFVQPEDMRHTYAAGNVYGHPKFSDGTAVYTSHIVKLVNRQDHKEIHTRSGSVYEIWPDQMDPAYAKEYPEAYNRLDFVCSTS